ncbi:PAS domain S-box protein [Catenuloplanes indicus]|uniref:histidine kinase n=1 Tax=Catenuloplanes indicus TaxID=137267 RepID=A0AAE3W2R4_9ACTN|nr:PAS domain S-box protein [Catenuloplanes indicus]MDQ0368394.1 PAS domain S-box-containing protein [Catenuloplanes indicus]
MTDLTSALTAACTRAESVLEVATEAAARIVGDGGGIRLVREDGRFGPMITHHRTHDGPEMLGEFLCGFSDRVDQGHLNRLRAGATIVFSSMDQQEFQKLAPPQHWTNLAGARISAVLACPLISDGAFLGYLALARTTEGATYTDPDVETARAIAEHTAAALHTARSVEALRASEDRYRNIVETTLDGVWQFDREGVTTFANAQMARMLGISREELLGLSVRGFLDNKGQQRLAKRLAERQQGRSEVYECRLIRADGSALWVQMSAAPLLGPDGEIIGSLALVSDITERIAARDMQRQLDQLRRVDSLGQLAGGIAHDFNNLLTVIAGSAEVLASDAEPGSDVEAMAQSIMRAAASGAALTHQLLAFGRRSPTAHTVSVPELLDGARDLLTRALGEHIDLRFKIDDDLWVVQADRGELEQALANLAVNARDAMGSGGRLTIEAHNTMIDPGGLEDEAASGRFVVLAVSDTGSGMDSETRSHAFEPFFTTKKARGAAGLGLATVYGIVHNSGGHIRLVSDPGIGTTVKIFLPAKEATEEPPVLPVENLRGQGHVLVVEDQPELAQLVRYLLQPAGYTVTVATDPASAVSHLHAGARPDLLLTDVVMPGMTGSELAKEMRAHYPDLRVLFMSGYTAGVLNPRGHLDENSTLIQKPFNRESLLTAVAKALGTRR